MLDSEKEGKTVLSAKHKHLASLLQFMSFHSLCRHSSFLYVCCFLDGQKNSMALKA